MLGTMSVLLPSARWDFQPGTEIAPGRTVVRLLGGGERYEAWLGWDEHLLSPVVFKLLRRTEVERGRSRFAIAREANILRSLAHPGIVRLLDAQTQAEQPYLMLEFLDGPRLSTLLRRFGPLSAEQLLPLAIEMGSALGYLHNEGLLHLDVKPQNIIMGAPPRLIDLSIARRLDEVPTLTAPLGTDAYMAPEQADAGTLAQIGPWTDVWGLGLTLFEAANGYRPFREPSSRASRYPQLSDDVAPFHRRVPEALASVIRRCLARDLDERPTFQEIFDALEDLMPDARDVALRRLRRRIR